MITPQNINSHELIGLETRIIESSNSQIVGLQGKIVFETKSMLEINTKNGLKKIPKNHSKWEISTREEKITVNGASINKRPQDRVGVRSK